MDIVSHGLWGGIAFGRKNKKAFAWSFFFGIAPDLFSFGIFTILGFLGLGPPHPDFSRGLPDPSSIPQYVHIFYNITHSFIIFSIVFCFVTFFFKRLFAPLAAWGLHIIVDIPTHTFDFFPTPFLWPISDFAIDGISWGTPIVWYSNLALLAALYAITILKMMRKKNKTGVG